MRQLAHWMCDVLADVNDAAVIAKTRDAVQQLCHRFPVYGS